MSVGFDCEKGDFVSPHGSGTTVDFIINVDGRGKAFQFIHKTITLDSLDPGGGFIVLKKHDFSDFKSEYLAPEIGYSTNLSAASSYDINKGIQGTQRTDWKQTYS